LLDDKVKSLWTHTQYIQIAVSRQANAHNFRNVKQDCILADGQTTHCKCFINTNLDADKKLIAKHCNYLLVVRTRKQWLYMPLVDIVRHVWCDYIFVFLQHIQETTAHLGRNFVGDVQKLAKVGVVVLT